MSLAVNKDNQCVLSRQHYAWCSDSDAYCPWKPIRKTFSPYATVQRNSLIWLTTSSVYGQPAPSRMNANVNDKHEISPQQLYCVYRTCTWTYYGCARLPIQATGYPLRGTMPISWGKTIRQRLWLTDSEILFIWEFHSRNNAFSEEGRNVFLSQTWSRHGTSQYQWLGSPQPPHIPILVFGIYLSNFFIYSFKNSDFGNWKADSR